MVGRKVGEERAWAGVAHARTSGCDVAHRRCVGCVNNTPVLVACLATPGAAQRIMPITHTAAAAAAAAAGKRQASRCLPLTLQPCMTHTQHQKKRQAAASLSHLVAAASDLHAGCTAAGVQCHASAWQQVRAEGAHPRLQKLGEH